MQTNILHNAIRKLSELPHLQIELIAEELWMNNKELDAQIIIKRGNNETLFNVEVKNRILPAMLPRIMQQMEDFQPYILIANYISTKAKQILQEDEIAYIDTAGNAFLSNESLYICMENKNSERPKSETSNRAFSPNGLKLVFHFLLHPDDLNKPYRFLAEAVRVSIDTVRHVTHGLLRDKWIVKVDEKTYQFTNRVKLFEEWVTAYGKKLKPKLKRRKFKWRNQQQNWRTTNLPEKSQWGAAAGAELLTEYLIADQFTIYSEQPSFEVAKQIQLLPSSTGDIEIVEKFWKEKNTENTVPAMLIYADLISEGDLRYLETAKRIYRSHVEHQL